jgi:hypothetical protein
MKKIYLLALALVSVSGAFAQRNVTTSPARRQFTREEISTMESRRQELHSSIASAMRVELLNENFNGVMGPVPANLPAGWSTTVVADADANDVDAFRVHTSTSANNGGYWPVPVTSTNNRFAGANDDGAPCDCDMIDAYLQTPELDFTDATNVAVTFDIFHDRGFGGGDATIQVSTDGGTTFNIIPLGTDVDGNIIDVLPVDFDVWQTIIVPVYDLSGEGSVIFRFQWTDGGAWASGFAVDNVIIGELPNLDLKVDKVKVGNWNQETFGFGFWDYSRVPVTQVSPIKATAVIFNKGFLDQTNAAVEFTVTDDGTEVSGSPFTSDQISANFLSLDKDTLSVTSSYTPANTGVIGITARVVSESGDDDNSNDEASTQVEITDFTYARDLNAAQAFVGPTSDFEYGNLFDVYTTDTFGGIDVAIGAGSTVGNIIQGRVYEFLGLGTDGPDLLDLGIETVEYEIQQSDLNAVGGNSFTFIPFADGDEPSAVTLEGEKIYLVVVACESGTRIPVSGSNEWVVSWLFDTDGWGATSSTPMVRLNSDEALSVSENVTESVLTLGQNVPNPAQDYTMINYSLNQPERVTLTVRDLSGRIVSVQEEGLKMAGQHFIRLNVDQFSAGVYTYTLTAGAVSMTKEMMVR